MWIYFGWLFKFLNSPILALVLDDFWSYKHYLTTAIWSWLPLRAQGMFLIRYQPHFWHILMLDNICQKRKLCGLFLWREFLCLKATEPLRRDFPIAISCRLVVLILSTLQGRKAESIVESLSDFELGTPVIKSSARTTKPLQE